MVLIQSVAAATVGGMVSCSAAGAHSLRYGNFVAVTEAVELVVAEGEKITLSVGSSDRYTAQLQALGAQYRNEIESHFPRLKRRASGYNLDHLLTTPFNPAKLVAGAEGTLGIVTAATLQLVPLPKATGIGIHSFAAILEATAAIPDLLKSNSVAIETPFSKPELCL